MAVVNKTVLKHKNKDTNVTTLIMPVTHIDSIVRTDFSGPSVVEKPVTDFGKGVAAKEITSDKSIFGRAGNNEYFWTRTELGLAAPVGDETHIHDISHFAGLSELLSGYADIVLGKIKDSQMPDGIRGSMRYKGSYAFGPGTDTGSLTALIKQDYLDQSVNYCLGTFYIATNTSPVSIENITSIVRSGDDTVNITLLHHPADMIEQGDWVVCVQATNEQSDPTQTPTDLTFAFISKKEQAASNSREGMVLLADSSNKNKRADLITDGDGIITEPLVKNTLREFTTENIPEAPSGRFISNSSTPYLLGVYDVSNITQSADYIQGAPLIRAVPEGWSYVIPYRFNNGSGADLLRQLIPFEIILHNHAPSGDFHNKVYNLPHEDQGDSSNPYYIHHLYGARLWNENSYRTYHFLHETKDTLVEVNHSNQEGQQRYYVQFKRLRAPLSAPTVSIIIKQHQAQDDTPRYVLYRLRPAAFVVGGDYCYIIGNADDGNPPMDLNAQIVNDTSTTNHSWVKTAYNTLARSHYQTHTFKMPGETGADTFDVKQVVTFEHILAPADAYLEFD